MTTRPTRVLILSGDSDNNLGDRAIVLATCNALRKRLPGLQISLLSSSPAAASRYFGARAIARGPIGFFSTLAEARKADLILVGGGGLFQDDDSLIKMPYWGLRVACVRLFARRIVGYSLGAGPLRSTLGKWSARAALACMERISVRDENARQCLQALTPKRVELVPDPALLLARDQDTETLPTPIAMGKKPMVGVALRQWFHNANSFVPHKYAFKYRLRSIPSTGKPERLAELLARSLDAVADHSGAGILFLPTYNVAHEADDRFCQLVRSRMRHRHTELLRIDDPVEYIAIVRHLDVMVGSRMHPTILAASVGTPIVGLAYNPKFDGFFRMLGAETSLFSIEKFLTGELSEVFTKTILDAMGKSHTGEDKAAPLQHRLDKFNDSLRVMLADDETVAVGDHQR